jgi:hypothetical protein
MILEQLQQYGLQVLEENMKEFICKDGNNKFLKTLKNTKNILILEIELIK